MSPRSSMLLLSIVVAFVITPCASGLENETRGTGFVVTSSGYILTAAHVVSQEENVAVLIGQKLLPAVVVKSDTNHDLALLKVEATGLQTVHLANANSVVRQDEVWALGYPFGEDVGSSLSMTGGHITAIQVHHQGRRFQTDAAVNPGNSGGPLVNGRGEVIGVVTSKFMARQEGFTVSESINFAVPISFALSLLANVPEFDFSVIGKSTKELTAKQIDQLIGPAVVRIVSLPNVQELAKDWYKKGAKSHDNGDYAKAEEYYTEAIRSDSGYSEAWMGRAALYIFMKQHEKAIADLSHIIYLQPDEMMYFMRGREYFNVSQYQPAIDDLTRSIQLKPDPDSFELRGHARKQLQQYQESISDFTQAIQLRAQNKLWTNYLIWDYLTRGQAYRQLGNGHYALSDFNKALDALKTRRDVGDDRRPSNVPENGRFERIDEGDANTKAIIHLERGRAYEVLHAYERAVGDFTEAIRLPQEAKLYPQGISYYRRGLIFFKQNKSADAISDFTNAIVIASTSSADDSAWWSGRMITSAYYHRGLSYMAIGDVGRSQADLKTACNNGIKEACSQ